MSRFKSWLSHAGKQLAFRFRHFMTGRYGTDKLNIAILIAGMLASLLSVFVRFPPLDLTLMVLSYGLMCWALFRTLSRNTYKRYLENRKYLMLVQRFKDRDYRYFDCPRCRQQVRVPRKKGKIAITCPKCKEKFIRKT